MAVQYFYPSDEYWFQISGSTRLVGHDSSLIIPYGGGVNSSGWQHIDEGVDNSPDINYLFVLAASGNLPSLDYHIISWSGILQVNPEKIIVRALYRGTDEFDIPQTIVGGMPLHYLKLVQNSNLLFAPNPFHPSNESTSLLHLENVYNVYDYTFEYSQLSGIEWSLSDLIRIDYIIDIRLATPSYFIDIEAIEVIFSGNPFFTQNNSQYLYISGPNQSSGNLNLRTLGGNPNESVNLLINGSSSVNNIAKLRPIKPKDHPLLEGIVAWWMPYPDLVETRYWENWDDFVDGPWVPELIHGMSGLITKDSNAHILTTEVPYVDYALYGDSGNTTTNNTYAVELPSFFLDTYFDDSEEATLVMWVKNNSNEPNQNWDGFVVFGNSYSHYPYGGPGGSPRGDYGINCDVFSNNRIFDQAPNSFDKTQWHQVAIRTKPGTNNYQLVQDGQVTLSGTNNSFTLPFLPYLMANSFFLQRYEGYQTDIKVYNKYLSIDELNQLREQTLLGNPDLLEFEAIGTDPTKGFPLKLEVANISGSTDKINLYIESPTPTENTGTIPLYIHSPSSILFSGIIPLAISGISSSSANLDLHMMGGSITSLNMFLKVIDPVEFDTHPQLNLYILGSEGRSYNSSLEYPSGLSLFINGAFLADSGSMNLFLETGSDVNSSGISLFTYGGFSERCNLYLECFESGLNTVPLYLLSYLPESESTNLFILGGTSSTMNLYLQGPQGIEESGNVHLSIYSSQESGLFNTLNLSISGENEPNSYLNLTIVGEGPYDSSTSYLYTFLKGIGNDDGSLPADLSCDFVLWNEFNQESNDLSLFLATASGTDGAIPVNGYMNMYLGRDFDGVSHNIPLCIVGPSGENNTMSMYLEGMPNSRESITLMISGIDITDNSVRLYTRGF